MSRLIAAVTLSLFLAVSCGQEDNAEPEDEQCADATFDDCLMPDGSEGIKECIGGEWTTCIIGYCTVGKSEICTTSCGGDGVRYCETTGVWGECLAPEQCNGKDDDCDGAVDEGETGLPLSNPCYCGTQPGEQACVGGEFETCSAGSHLLTETCNGLDDDCDSLTDEGCDDDKDGYCDGTMDVDPTLGVLACPSGGGDCNDGAAYVHPGKDEQCNGLDDDCDGETDEEMELATCGLGECKNSVETCVEGIPQSCDPFAGASEDLNDGKDNDCDGLTDEDFAQLCGEPGDEEECGSNAGECTVGLRECGADGTWSDCSGTLPAPELCDGKDNDCDGIVDNGNPEGGDSCGTDIGECASGIWACLSGELKCLGGIPEAQEICDAKDNDCDGDVDEVMTPDTWEDNDGCGQAADLGEVLETAEQPLVVSGMLFHLSAAHDTDWYTILASEKPDFAPCEWVIPAPDNCMELTVTLDLPEGVDYDLCVYAENCAGSEMKECSTAPVKGFSETVTLQWPGSYGGNDDRVVFVEVKGKGSDDQSCVQYSLSFDLHGECPEGGACWWE